MKSKKKISKLKKLHKNEMEENWNRICDIYRVIKMRLFTVFNFESMLLSESYDADFPNSNLLLNLFL